jgi:hypothetical protein
LRGNKSGAAAKEKMPVWLFRTIIGAVLAAVLVTAYLVASVTVPLVWANSIRDQIGGQLGNSIPLGMFYGFTFSFVPVLIAWQAHRRKFNKWFRVSLVVLGVFFTLPNLLTLSVLFGSTQTSVDARSIWANSANWFGTWSQIFMVAGVVCAVAVIVLGRMWIQRGRTVRKIKAAEKLVRESHLARERADKKEARERRRHPGATVTGEPPAGFDGGSPAGSATPGTPPQV